jgi:hypothetical protein
MNLFNHNMRIQQYFKCICTNNRHNINNRSLIWNQDALTKMLGGAANVIVLLEVIILLKHTKCMKNLFFCILCILSDHSLLFLKIHETFLRLFFVWVTTFASSGTKWNCMITTYSCLLNAGSGKELKSIILLYLFFTLPRIRIFGLRRELKPVLTISLRHPKALLCPALK